MSRRYPIANRTNLKLRARDLLGNNYSPQTEKDLLACLNEEDICERLDKFNKVLDGHGVEGTYCPKDDSLSFEYVNMGDSYDLTIVLFKGKLRITTWGDIVEYYMEEFSD